MKYLFYTITNRINMNQNPHIYLLIFHSFIHLEGKKSVKIWRYRARNKKLKALENHKRAMIKFQKSCGQFFIYSVYTKFHCSIILFWFVCVCDPTSYNMFSWADSSVTRKVENKQISCTKHVGILTIAIWWFQFSKRCNIPFPHTFFV